MPRRPPVARRPGLASLEADTLVDIVRTTTQRLLTMPSPGDRPQRVRSSM